MLGHRGDGELVVKERDWFDKVVALWSKVSAWMRQENLSSWTQARPRLARLRRR